MSLKLRFLCGLTMVMILAGTAGAAVVINELFYDPASTDDNKEFIELYNNGTAAVDLGGWQIQWGGTSYSYGTYTIPPGTIIQPGSYFLIGGSLVDSLFAVTPNVIQFFNFQNGGSETDAVRLNNLAGYTDTCPYDWPNNYGLAGDRSNPADSLECNPDIYSGHSLSRVAPGVDTDYATDWEDLATPTPQAAVGVGTPPVITNTMPNPYLPDHNQPVVINTRIYDDGAVDTARVHYNPGTGFIALQLFDDGLHNDGAAGDSVYGNTISGYPAGSAVTFYIRAVDNAGLVALAPSGAPGTTYRYEYHNYANVTSIAELRTNDSLGVPTTLDEIHTVIGYVTATSQFGASGPAHLQTSATGGPAIAVFDPVISTAPWLVGQQVKVTGWIGFYNGLTEIVDDPSNFNYDPVIEVLSTSSVASQWISDLDLLGEDDESLLIHVHGVRFCTTGTFAGNTNYWVTSGADSFEVRIDQDTDLPGTAIPTLPITVQGLISQFDASSPYTAGYQLLPRSTADLIPAVTCVTMTPVNPPIVIPATGGSFDYTISLTNNGTGPVLISSLQLQAELPNGSFYNVLAQPVSLTLPAGLTVTRIKAQTIPATAPAGLYSYRAMMTFPMLPEVFSDGFPFTKSATLRGDQVVEEWGGEWLCDWQESGPEAPVAATTVLPQAHALDQNFPNPFNPTTAVSYQLASADRVSLRVFDTAGRVVSTLVDGWREAGVHQVTFDGTGLPSGMYLLRMQAGDFTATQKMMLVK
ncbi:MAG: T9SS C-terminal target domain-containing protein [Candidatus Zixiibacteriota bacterium]|nr:MAG: T9SS C-terminal target domain-containing protein [candidate division Zixibacteria bacterium]